MNDLKELLKKNRAFLFLLALGLLLIALSGGGKASETDCATDSEKRLEAVLGEMTGVGGVRVLLSEAGNARDGYIGAVVVCDGAGSPAVRLRVTEAVAMFTGLGSNKILVEKTGS